METLTNLYKAKTHVVRSEHWPINPRICPGTHLRVFSGYSPRKLSENYPVIPLGISQEISSEIPAGIAPGISAGIIPGWPQWIISETLHSNWVWLFWQIYDKWNCSTHFSWFFFHKLHHSLTQVFFFQEFMNSLFPMVFSMMNKDFWKKSMTLKKIS